MRTLLLAGCAALSIFSIGYTYNSQHSKSSLNLEPKIESPSKVLDYSVGVYSVQKDGPGTGSGTVIDHYTDQYGQYQSVILTCAHVIGDSKELKVSYKEELFPAKILINDPNSDLALITVPSKLPIAPIYSGQVNPGTRELVAGNPFDASMTLTEGFVGTYSDKPIHSMDSNYGSNVKVRYGSAPVYPGNSGGGVFVYKNNHWELYGVEEEMLVVKTHLMNMLSNPPEELNGPLAGTQYIATVNMFISSQDFLPVLTNDGFNLGFDSFYGSPNGTDNYSYTLGYKNAK